MDAMPLVENQAPVVDDASLKEVKIELDANDNKHATRDTTDDVKDFLEKENQFFNDATLSQAPINLDSLSLIQKIKLASLA